MMIKKFRAWAISTNTKKSKPSFIGRYWWFHGAPKIPDQFEGNETCLFKTRAIARKYLKTMKSGGYVSYPKAKVVPVEVTIREV